MAYQFTQAKTEDIPVLYSIVAKRVDWMAEKGLKQWNSTDYLNVYPISYFELHQKNGRLYKMQDLESNEILGIMVLLDKDARWDGYSCEGSFFVHNFATLVGVKGIGRLMLMEAENLSVKLGKEYIRLDCPVANEYLNNFYQEKGYIPVGQCVDGAYTGTLREKKLINTENK